MHLAGKAFDVIFRDHPFSSVKKCRQFRYCVRMATLLHDVGHGRILTPLDCHANAQYFARI